MGLLKINYLYLKSALKLVQKGVTHGYELIILDMCLLYVFFCNSEDDFWSHSLAVEEKEVTKHKT